MKAGLGCGEGNPGQAMTRVEISEDAQADLNGRFLFFEVQGRGLGDYFIACLRADIEWLTDKPGEPTMPV